MSYRKDINNVNLIEDATKEEVDMAKDNIRTTIGEEIEPTETMIYWEILRISYPNNKQLAFDIYKEYIILIKDLVLRS